VIRPVPVQYFKDPQSPHWRHEMFWLGEDAHGTWLAGGVGTVVQRGAEPAQRLTRAFVQLIPSGRWWTALFNGPGDHDMPVYVDITTVARWPSPDRVQLIDLDLDVVQRGDGSVYVDDEDEFEEHRTALGYPPLFVDSARAAAARLVLDLEGGAPPFDGTGRQWLVKVI
jgi:hypothetical protein